MATWIEKNGRVEARFVFEALGGMSGALAVWPDGFVLGRFTSQRVIPPEKRDEIQAVFTRENTRNRKYAWECGRSGQVTLRVRGRQRRRAPRWKESAAAEVMARMTAMDERLGVGFIEGVLA